ncbi:MAG TPA: sodium:solute symporter family protein [Saprospiraceae bacterium]|nr:sodium:solute symporter family protein [Saprospiraceae bacterium]MCB9269032.1 sodium:solute symporter family protein [Lewinellaceae bacterium]HPG05546.1 sodium:solute symporter family protein [Saprospiraceae bacterium]HPQ98450.1 sodium:solute symporter family protein [Saprospiraceae bacterium]HRV85053.1 sodium:solute symporter family protein [Saprospiraceae bacterium]
MLLVAILVYLVFTVSIGYFAKRWVSNAEDFIMAGRNLPAYLNAAAVFALWFGSETVLGASSEFLEHGLLGVIEDPFGAVLGLVLVAVFYARRLYRLNVYTIIDLFRMRFGRVAEQISGVMMIFSFFGYCAAQLVALGLLLSTITGMALPTTVLISAGMVIFYTFWGGMWAVSITDFLQSIMIVTGLVALTIVWGSQSDGFQSVIHSVSSSHYQFFPHDGPLEWVHWITAWMIIGLGSIASQDVFQRVNSARSEKAAYYSTLIGAGLYLIFAMIPLYLILLANHLFPEMMAGNLQTVLPTIVLQKGHIGLQILFFGSLVSAILSTASGSLLAPASILSENILKPLVADRLTSQRFLWLTRLCVLLVGLISVFFALGHQNIYDLVGISSVFGLVSLFIPLNVALFTKWSNRTGALWSMICGAGIWIYFEYFYPLAVDALWPGVLASLLGYLVGTWIYKSRNE